MWRRIAQSNEYLENKEIQLMSTRLTSISGCSRRDYLKVDFCSSWFVLNVNIVVKMSFCRASLSAVRCSLFQRQTAVKLIPCGATVIRCMSAGTTEEIA